MSQLYNSLSHSKWDCKYYLIFVPKMRKKTLRRYPSPFRTNISCTHCQKDCKIVKGHLTHDYVHMLIEIPSKHQVSAVVGFLKGKSAIAIAREFGGKQRNFNGEHFWARGYAVSTVGLEEETIKKYIVQQEQDEVPAAQGAF